MPYNILLGLTGSVATIKAKELVQGLTRLGQVRIVITKAASHFLDGDLGCALYTDDDEWQSYSKRTDPVLHIELRRWAHVLIIAPLSANTLAKLAHGFADNLLTCIARAWRLGKSPLIVAPAMNTAMWEHPITVEHLTTLEKWAIEVIYPIEKTLICGDIGIGAMQTVDNIIACVEEILHTIPLI